MNRFVLLGVGALALAACSRPAPSDDGASAPASAPGATAPSPPPPTAAPVAAPAEPALQPPSFDCHQARGDAEVLVCGDARLAALDRQLAALYKRVQTSPDELDIAAEQRGWVKGRDACWQAVDRHRCLVESYQTRIVELNIGSGAVAAPVPVRYQCDDASKPLSVAFYNGLEPQAAVVSWGKDQAIVFPAASASGSRYTREGVAFWEHQGEATLDFYGTALHCKAAG
ncbi:MliC family protein [Stenotrophomonas sp.]|uniref:MliC family protein n=1 Tax=Stenotrophomonas sp. TaxID=69392 RepID=UPI002FCBFD73